MSTWYRTGTVTVTNGSTAVTGILTGWADATVKTGDALFVPASSNYPGEISTINSATSITLNAAWHGTNQTSVAYFIFKGMEWGDVTRLAVEISELIDSRVEILGGVGAPSNSLGSDGSVYFRSDVPEYYTKDAGAWSSPIALTGPEGPTGALSTGTSTSSVAIGTGSKTFTTQASRAWVVGTRLRIASTANPTTAYMEGVVTSYSSTTVILTIDKIAGSGTIASWNLGIAGDVGSTGATGASYAGTSTTSLAIGTGTKVFTTQAGLAYVVGSRVRAANTADTANYMEGRVTSYSGTSLTLSVDVTGGSGTLASWNLSIAGDRGIQGVQGIQGDQGLQGATGPGYAATSTTSLAIGTGSKVFTTQAGLSYVVGASRARASSTNGANYVEGLVTAYSGTSLTIAADTTGGSGTISTWNISLAGTPGTNGTNGSNGTVTATTSTTSNTTATGSKSFTTAATTGLAYSVGQRIRIVSASNTSNWMSGLVTSFSGTSLVVNVDLIGPSPATATDWNIALTGEKGDPGAAGGFASLTATKGNLPIGDGTTFGTLSVGSDGTMAVADSAATYGVAWRAIDAVHADGYWTRSTVASAATCDIGAASTTYITISGTTTITSLGTGANKLRFVQFSGSLTLTYNGTSLILPGTANITTQAGDSGVFVSDGSGNWRCIAWTPIGYLSRGRLNANRTYYVRKVLGNATVTIAAPGVWTLNAHNLANNDPVVVSILENPTTATISEASPAVVTMTNTFAAGQPIRFESTIRLPQGISHGVTYYVIATGLSGSSFQFSTTVGGSAVNTTTPTVTISNASPGVVTEVGHGRAIGSAVVFATTGALPTGLTAGTTYFVKTTPTADTFTVAATPEGTAINTSSAGSGTHTIVQGGTHRVVTVGTLPTGITEGTVYFARNVTTNTFELSTTSGGASITTTGTQEGVFSIATGNDTNTGLDPNFPLLQPQTALNRIFGNMDLGGFDAIAQLADSTYASPVTASAPQVGSGRVILSGNTTTPANTKLAPPAAACISVLNAGTTLYLRGLKFRSANAGIAITNLGTARLIGTLEFGACATFYITMTDGRLIRDGGGAIICSGNSNAAIAAGAPASINLQGTTTQLFGIPGFAQSFVKASQAAYLNWALSTITGLATGQRYNVGLSANIFTNSGGASYFPGSLAGSDNSGAGHYT